MSDLSLLLEEDRAFIERKGWDVEIKTLDLGNNTSETHILIKNFNLSERYNPRKVNILLKQLPGYPDVKMDMLWTQPTVVKTDGGEKPGATDGEVELHGIKWQQWSRHIDWRAGIDNLESFSAAIFKELLT